MNTKSKLYSELKPKAIELREKGYTFSKICDVVGFIPKGTLSNWLRNIELNNRQNKRIRDKMISKGLIGRQIGSERNHLLRMERISNIKRIAQKEYNIYIRQEYFLSGLVLYLAEGTKKNERFEFMNSDFKLVKFMMLWINNFGKIDFDSLRFRLYIHKLYEHEKCKEFWSSMLNIRHDQFLKTIYKPTNRVYKKNPSYKGCIGLEVSGSELYLKTMAWRDCFYTKI